MKELVIGTQTYRKIRNTWGRRSVMDNRWRSIEYVVGMKELLNEIERLRQIEEKYEQIKGEVR